MSNFINTLDDAFKNIEQSLVGKITGATADVVKKTVAVAHVAEHLAEAFAADAENTWSSFDNTPTSTIVTNATVALAEGDYEKAALGIIYLIYQESIEVTNQVTAAAAELATDVKADLRAVKPKTEGFVAKVEDDIKEGWDGIKADVKAAVNDVERLFGGSSAPATTSAPTTVSAPQAPVSTSTAALAAIPSPTPAPVVVAANPLVAQPVIPVKPVLAS